jgi:hypothetical protein
MSFYEVAPAIWENPQIFRKTAVQRLLIYQKFEAESRESPP